MANSEHFEYFVNFPLAGISLLLLGYMVLHQVIITDNLAHTSKTELQMQSWGGSTSSSILPLILCPRFVWSRSYGKQSLLRKKNLTPLCTFLKFHTHLEEN